MTRRDKLDCTVWQIEDVWWRLGCGDGIAEELPVWTLCKDLGRTQTLILTVVPLNQVRIGFSRGSKPSQFTSSGRSLQRAGKYLGECHALETFSELPCVTLPV